ncbi:4Fe-4S cluster-binding domain-containing protein [Opitutaceae bacterium TAV4]|nr:4Fe-4S cluster-binding domain-containing protein [Opitutaceae bacterium TAV4]RRJ98366.1 4Fe-4S cluster-binding domain-containing protein [Opitutaceae bacterium TAV3]
MTAAPIPIYTHPSTPATPPRSVHNSRSALAAQRATAARASLSHCQLCAHLCNADRTAFASAQRGTNRALCHAGPSARVFSAQTEVSDELAIIPTYAIALSGCDLRCDFCITGRESWNPLAGAPFDAPDLARRATAALNHSPPARTIMILGGEPTIHLPDILDLVAHLPDDTPLVWKTNGRASPLARAWLANLFDTWIVDYKFGNDACAARLAASPPGYTATLRDNLLRACPRFSTTPPLIVRHLLMPGHVECCWRPIATWLSAHLPGVPVSLRTGFWPAWQSRRHPELTRTCNAHETALARDIAREHQLVLAE